MSKNYKPAAVIRDSAKGFLNGRYGVAVGAFFIVGVLTYLASSAFGLFYQLFTIPFTRTGYLNLSGFIAVSMISIVLDYFTFVITGVLNIGVVFFYLKLNCRLSPSIGDLFIGFRESFRKSLTISAILALPRLLIVIPGEFVQPSLLGFSQTLVLVSSICVIAGTIIYIVLWLGLMPTMYIMHDFPDYSATETVKASFKKMRGNKARLFGLMFSFIPYYLLGFLTFGIGFIWIYPLLEASKAQFYLDLMNPAQEK